MSVTLSEMKKLTEEFEAEPKDGKLGSILKKYGRRHERADPVKDIKEIRMDD